VDGFSPAAKGWFEAAFAEPTEIQRRGWSAVARGEHSLLIAPTGRGKTLAAFLWCLDRLSSSESLGDARGVRTLYVSPLKALVYDVERNLRTPLAGISREAERLGLAFRAPRVAVRTGDTTSRERREQHRDPADILVTTPESLYLLLGSQARDVLASIETVIVDEVHALAPTKRGAHLALSLERLSALTRCEPQRIGLSATARPVAEVARFLGGDRPVTIVDTSALPRIDLRIAGPVADMPNPGPPGEVTGERGLWPMIYPELLALLRGHRTTINFVNSRGLC
jgi:ATP-dependent Lhr-like helicase